ncbi:tripartite tricarboxylate transporter substrate binding protein [Marinisporobacter balticus]|uniref:Tripartite-type tricarboxylate transporter receptor subunit TctC n=1 Tax=Marinisporobacter balticus TaxID=2018667 RepID=A0A4R2KUD1_9FIRM|nr:tripartite tricarboxylate transporter substrate binding protein [Marinisporobacter balticus]TCO77413.1 tripartite-type tricarboxylate transporter receptor subunit TctC [Marinisporobacter balticus]
MKKIMTSLLLVILSMTLFACNGTGTETNRTKNENKEVHQKNQEESLTFPNKNIQIIVPFSPGGGTDLVARAIADTSKKYFNKPVVVVNKTGAGGAVGIAEGIQAKPDGYTVTMITTEVITLENLGLSPFKYKDYQPVLQINEDPAALTVKADAPYDTVKEFIEYAKKNPGKVKVGNSGTGAIWHFAAEAIENETGIKFKHIPFDGAAPATVALLGAQIDAVTVSPGEVLPHVKNGKLKVLGVLSPERIESLPNVPTFEEQGYDISMSTWRGLGVSKETPPEILEILEDKFTKTALDPDFKEVMNQLGLGYKVSDANAFEKLIQESDVLFKNLIQELNFEKRTR